MLQWKKDYKDNTGKPLLTKEDRKQRDEVEHNKQREQHDKERQELDQVQKLLQRVKVKSKQWRGFGANYGTNHRKEGKCKMRGS